MSVREGTHEIHFLTNHFEFYVIRFQRCRIIDRQRNRSCRGTWIPFRKTYLNALFDAVALCPSLEWNPGGASGSFAISPSRKRRGNFPGICMRPHPVVPPSSFRILSCGSEKQPPTEMRNYMTISREREREKYKSREKRSNMEKMIKGRDYVEGEETR